MKILLRNRATKERLNLYLHQFDIKFEHEINNALESFLSWSNNKAFNPYKRTYDKSDFYFDLRYNFNNYSNSNWYIEKIL